MIAPSLSWAFFFDLDGTLIELAETPAGARVDQALQRLILRLYGAAERAVALISGRALVDLDRLFPDVVLPAAGQHGVERRDATGAVHYHAFPSTRLEWAHRQLTQTVESHPGLLVEHKGLSLALHYRLAPALEEYAHQRAASLLERLGPHYCLQAGKSVVELKPAGKDKGVAIREFMKEAPFRGRTPVFLGDDATDEFGFETVNRMAGHSIKVGPGETVAAYRLASVPAVRAWLREALGEDATP